MSNISNERKNSTIEVYQETSIIPIERQDILYQRDTYIATAMIHMNKCSIASVHFYKYTVNNGTLIQVYTWIGYNDLFRTVLYTQDDEIALCNELQCTQIPKQCSPGQTILKSYQIYRILP